MTCQMFLELFRFFKTSLPLLLALLVFVWSGAGGSSAGFCAEKTPEKELEKVRSLMKDHRLQADAMLSSLERLYPEDVHLVMMRAELLRDLGQVALASREFARAAQLAPADPFPLIALAQLSLKQMELEESLTYAQQAMARDPKCLPARVELVDVLLQCGQTAEAERQLRSIPSDFRGNPAVEQLAYRLSLKKGDLSGARAHLQNAISGSRQGALKWRLEDSELLQTMGENDAARTELERIIAADPDNLAAHLHLARLLEAQYHDYPSALAQYNEALRLDPLSAQAISGRERCQLKRRNIALQIKIALRDYWSRLSESGSAAAPH